MIRHYLKPTELIIPLGLLAFGGPANNLISTVFNPVTRWVFLAILGVYLLVTRLRYVVAALTRPVSLLLVVNAAWILMTITWSQIPEITIAKSVAFIAVSVVMLAAGYSWVMRHSVTQTFDFLWIFSALAIGASLSGELEGDLSSGMAQYAGQTANPNFLGFVLAVSSVWLLWRAYVARFQNRKHFWIFIGLLAVSVFSMILAHSRASLLMFMVEVFFALMVLGNFRTRLLYIAALAMFGISYLALPTATGFVEQYVNKSDFASSEEVGGGVFSSRQQIWLESLEQAKRGGSIGGGYGVTIGEAFTGKIGASISSGQYGREQGNSQLALIEQTGWAGLILHLFLIVTIMIEIFAAFGRLHGADRAALGLLGGSVLGMVCQSVFEAWWVAPGAVEFAVFWALVGALLAVNRRAQSAPPRRMRVPMAPVPPNVVAAPAPS